MEIDNVFITGDFKNGEIEIINEINNGLGDGIYKLIFDINKNQRFEELFSLENTNLKVIKKINKKTLAVFITHAQGFNGFTDNLLNELKKRNIFLIEDVCESHGAKHKNKKLGTFGIISNFSFYYAHHMSTIEGGMVCTNNDEVYQILKMMRAHGLLRESDSTALKKKYVENYMQTLILIK